MNILIKYMLSCSIVLMFSACSKQASVEDLMDAEVQLRIDKFKTQKRQNCQEFILEEAEKEVDSTMYLKIGSTIDGSIIIPQKPVRPTESLAYKVALDTAKIRNFLPDSINYDSLK